ncbi:MULTISPECIES: lanthionine synthetase C family protein [Streptomyces]|uniref:lanthionine synthetase C family protein n=1 Tax=Streptomyces TaxID=1883 RepID=UPI00017E8624|nr:MULTISPECIES: lanthionine synthetase C family protein [Streptomyces]EDX23856.1 lanthionine synthetase C protein [Streptomyces sp. Mg1]WSS03490.1 lanthionine synthetase C family protein [Streptomyces goshikiensis]
MISASLAGQARATAAMITSRLADPAHIEAAVAASTPDPNALGPRPPSSLLAGDAGIALLLRHAGDAPHEEADRWRRAGHAALLRAVRDTREAPLTSAGIVTGSAGLALAMAEFAATDHRYRPGLDGVHIGLADQTRRRLADGGPVGGPRFEDYDVLGGASGVLGHLLTQAPDRTDPAPVHALIDDLVRFCTAESEGHEPRWVVPLEHYPLPPRTTREAHGFINLGMAHGIPGPLAALALAWKSGYRRPRMGEAIANTVAALSAAAVRDEFGVIWPGEIPVGPDGRHTDEHHPARSAWCYGVPGIAVALLTAADALADRRLRNFAIEAIEADLRRVEATLDRRSPSLCHGLAGLLSIAEVFARTTGSATARAFLPFLTEHLLSHCSADLPFGVQNREPPDLKIDNPDFLCGAAGVAAALWTVSTPVSRGWQRALLIA